MWALERKRFRHVMVNTEQAAKSKAELFLKSVTLLSPLMDTQRRALADKMEELTYIDSEYVVKMGDIADALFFIKSGEVAVHQGDSKGDMMRMATGDVFGESCLEPTSEDAVRKAFQNDDGDGLLTMTVREPRCLLDIVQSTCFYVRLERRGKPVASSSHYVSSNSRAGGHDDGDY